MKIVSVHRGRTMWAQAHQGFRRQSALASHPR